jgi:L-ribulose-5-phosphate 3-epimerase
MKLGNYSIGVCEWSLRPSSMHELVTLLADLKLSHVQLALAPLLEIKDPAARAEVLKPLVDANVVVTAGMIGFATENYATIASIRRTGGLVPDDTWPQRRQATIDAAHLAADLGVRAVSLHAGFIPPSSDHRYPAIVKRFVDVAGEFKKLGVRMLMETGQERSTDLLQFINDINSPSVGVNFDPANMLLYGAGDPIEAIATLGRHIRHVHIKDARTSTHPGVEWGKEVPVGEGDVKMHAFLRALSDAEYTGPLIIEREAGKDRVTDVQAAIDTLEAHLGAEAA